MNRRSVHLLIFTISLVMSVGCSNQWREAGEITAEEVNLAISEAKESVTISSGGGSTSEALDMADDPNTYIYYAYGPGPLGPPGSVASLWTFDFMDFGLGSFDWTWLTEARVFFFDQLTSSGNRYGLVIGVKIPGKTSFTYSGLVGDGGVDDGMLYAELGTGGQTKLVVRSYDIDDGELATVIQLRAWLPDDTYVGKFSTLVGFLP